MKYRRFLFSGATLAVILGTLLTAHAFSAHASGGGVGTLCTPTSSPSTQGDIDGPYAVDLNNNIVDPSSSSAIVLVELLYNPNTCQEWAAVTETNNQPNTLIEAYIKNTSIADSNGLDPNVLLGSTHYVEAGVDAPGWTEVYSPETKGSSDSVSTGVVDPTTGVYALNSELVAYNALNQPCYYIIYPSAIVGDDTSVSVQGCLP